MGQRCNGGAECVEHGGGDGPGTVPVTAYGSTGLCAGCGSCRAAHCRGCEACPGLVCPDWCEVAGEYAGAMGVRA